MTPTKKIIAAFGVSALTTGECAALAGLTPKYCAARIGQMAKSGRFERVGVVSPLPCDMETVGCMNRDATLWRLRATRLKEACK
jgi:hypothetical protein